MAMEDIFAQQAFPHYDGSQIIPKPLTESFKESFFILSQKTVITGNREQFLQLDHDFIKRILPFALNFKDNPSSDITSISLIENNDFTEEQYSIDISTNNIALFSNSTAGFLYAFISLSQLIKTTENNVMRVYCQHINDKPRFKWRGFMLDVARHFFPLNNLKKIVDCLALHKINRFHLHLTDDQGWRIPIEGYPLLTEIAAHREGTVIGHTTNPIKHYDNTAHSGFYRHDELKTLVEYCASRNIEVIPEIDLPGHVSALLAAYPEMGCLNKAYTVQQNFGIFSDILSPNEASLLFIEKLIDQISLIFPAPFIHIGGDEVDATQWHNDTAAQNIKVQEGFQDFTEIQGFFMQKLHHFAHKKGKKLIGWDEILDFDMSKDTTIMSWRGMDAGVKAASAGFNVIMSPVEFCYFDFYQTTSINAKPCIHGFTPLSQVYTFEPLPDNVDPTKKQLIIGAQANLWTEYIDSIEAVEQAILPRLTALSEVLWSLPEHKNWLDFNCRLANFIPRLNHFGYQFSDAMFHPFIKTQLNEHNQIELTIKVDSPFVDIFYGAHLDQLLPYQGSIIVEEKKTFYITTKNSQKPLKQIGHEVITLWPHKALGKKIQFSHSPDVSNNPLGDKLLTNGMIASNRVFQYHEWGAFGAQGMQGLIDLSSPTEISLVRIGVQAGHHRTLYLPSSIHIALSMDNKEFTPVAEMNYESISTCKGELVFHFTRQKAQFISIKIDNQIQHYCTEKQTKRIMPFYIDEVVIE